MITFALGAVLYGTDLVWKTDIIETLPVLVRRHG